MAWWGTLAVLFIAGELYFFLMQRSALEVCRSHSLPAEARFALLPATYKAAWILAWGKWLPLAVLAWQGAWLIALGIWVVGFLLSSIVPVPHGFFFAMFYAALDTDEMRTAPELRSALGRALESVDREHQVTGRFRNSA